MKHPGKRISGLLTILVLFHALIATAFGAGTPEIKSEAYLVLDAQTGQVLAEKNAHQKMYPASITKILTCALALKYGSPADTTTVSADAVYSIARDTTHIALSEGEVIPVEALLNATMIESANDAANGLAEYVSGSLEAFVELMNKTAVEAGATDSHFVNAHGLQDKDHLTTAYDMAMITKWALDVDGFRTLFGATEYTIAPTNKQAKQRQFGTHDHMLVESAYSYQGAEGGKLGWTPEAQHTLVTLAERDGLELICVVLKSKNQYEKYEDTAALLDQCFENYSAAVFEGTRFTHAPIPVYAAAGKQVATVALLPQDIQIARPATLAKADISAVLAVPDRYNYEDRIAPAVRFLDKQGNLLCEVPLKYDLLSTGVGDDLQTIPSVSNVGLKQGTAIKVWVLFGIGGLALLIGLLFAVRAINLRRLQRREDARCRAAKRAARQLNEHIRPKRPPQERRK